MLSIKAFASKITHTDNQAATVNAFGEISTDSLTFSKDVGIYSRTTDESIVLHTFVTKNDGVHQVLEQEWTDHIFEVANHIYNKVKTSRQLFADELGNELIRVFDTKAENFRVGAIVEDDGVSCPEWVSWKRSGSENQIRIWFSDESFKRRYDEFQIVIVPPIEVVDELFSDYGIVLSKVQAQTPSVISQRVEIAKDRKPPTVTRTLEFPWYDRRNPERTINTVWTAIIYGKAGDNIDSIKDAIVEQITQISSVSIDEWKKIFPDIFKRTEFIFVPQWDVYAIPNRTIEEGIYSPVVKLNSVIDKYLPYYQHYPKAHLESYGCIVSHIYRSLNMFVCSGYENRDRKYLLTDVYPDYITENTLSQDFNRMRVETKEWSKILSEMVIHAENMGPYSDVPERYARIKRDGKYFISRSVGNIHYLVALKCNFYPNSEE